ncbi:MAG: hypothetical protein ABI548_27135 [Polyangiaceae bacterium]
MKITMPIHDESSARTHRERVAEVLQQQAPLWAVAPGHTLEVPRATLGAGDDVLLADVADAASALTPHQRMQGLVDLGIVLRAGSTEHRRADVTAADSASVRFTATTALTTIAHHDNRTPCAHGVATPGMRLLPSDVTDGLSGLHALEARGLVVREQAAGE